MVSTAQGTRRTQYLVRSQALFQHMVLSLTKRVGRVDIGQTCGYLNVEGIQHLFVPSTVTADAYILITVHLLRCPIGFKPLFNHHFHSLLTMSVPLQGNTPVKRDRP